MNVKITYETNIKLLGNVGQNPLWNPFKSFILFFPKLLLNRVVNKENLYWMKTFFFFIGYCKIHVRQYHYSETRNLKLGLESKIYNLKSANQD